MIVFAFYLTFLVMFFSFIWVMISFYKVFYRAHLFCQHKGKDVPLWILVYPFGSTDELGLLEVKKFWIKTIFLFTSILVMFVLLKINPEIVKFN